IARVERILVLHLADEQLQEVVLAEHALLLRLLLGSRRVDGVDRVDGHRFVLPLAQASTSTSAPLGSASVAVAVVSVAPSSGADGSSAMASPRPAPPPAASAWRPAWPPCSPEAPMSSRSSVRPL